MNSVIRAQRIGRYISLSLALLLGASLIAFGSGVFTSQASASPVGSVSKHKPKSHHAPAVKQRPSLIPPPGVATYTAPNYSATHLFRDSGFRPGRNGFLFVNYSVQPGSPPEQNLNAADVESIFGSQVCVTGSGATCELTPPAQAWETAANDTMEQGHCYGFSVLSVLFFTHQLSSAAFGAALPSQLSIVHNTALQNQIAIDDAHQNLLSVQSQETPQSPNQVLSTLQSSLGQGSVPYVLMIYKGLSGHAVVPFALQSKGGGNWVVLVYDNNVPGKIRPLYINTVTNTWHYTAVPGITASVYQGNATSNLMTLSPIAAGEGQQPCSVCNGDNQQTSGNTGTILPAAKQYDQVTLIGSSPQNHAHLYITNTHGQHAGVTSSGRIVNTIPGVIVERPTVGVDWSSATEPIFDVPVKTTFTVTINGSDLKKPTTEKLYVIGPGDYILIKGIRLKPRQNDTLKIFGKNSGYVYTTAAQQTQTPTLALGLVSQDASYGFGIQAGGLRDGSKIAINVSQKTGRFEINTAGTKPKGVKENYGISEVRLSKTGTLTFANAFAIKNGNIAFWNFLNFTPHPTISVGPRGGPFVQRPLLLQKGK